MLRKYFYVLLLVGELVALEKELKLVHVLFVHPSEYSFSPYSIDTNAIEDVSEDNSTMKRFILEPMTNEEKLIVYNLGVRLRQRYDTFLGDIYTTEVSRTRTTDSDISKMSGSLVNAGLWPPSEEQQWSEDLLWQPIPSEYVPRTKDILLMGRLCRRFIEATDMVRKSMEVYEIEKKHRRLYSFVSEKTGLEIRNSEGIAHLYKSLKARASRNLTLPAWADGIFPNGEMRDVTYLEDLILSKSNIQRKLNGGFLIKKILSDSAHHAKGSLDNGRKIMIYGADSELFNGVLQALGTGCPHIPNISSALYFEFLRNHDNNTYEMKIFHDLGKKNLTIPLIIPGCISSQNSKACDFQSLILSLKNILPGDNEILCGQSIERTEIISGEDMTLSNASRLSHGIFVIFCISILTNLLLIM